MSENKGKQQSDEPAREYGPLGHIRLRPGMYVGGDDAKAMTNIVSGVLFELVPQIRCQACTALAVVMLDAKTLQLRHDGHPLLIRESGTSGLSMLEMTMTRITPMLGYRLDDLSVRPVGTLGTGYQAANALSSHLTLQVAGEGGLWEQQYAQGLRITDLTRLRDLTDDDQWTTSLTFTLDEDIFRDHSFDASALEGLFFDYAHLHPGLRVSFENCMTGDRSSFYAPSGLAHYLEQENRSKQVLHRAIRLSVGFDDVFRRGNPSGIGPVTFELDVAIQFLTIPTSSRRGFVNAHDSGPDGTQIGVCYRALRECFLGQSSILGRPEIASLFDHMTLVVSLWHPAPQFEGGRGMRLMTLDFVQRAYEDLLVALTLYFKKHSETLKALEKLALSKRPKKRPRKIR